MWGCVGRDLYVVPYWRSLYLCVFFSVAAELCILSSCWGWGRLLLSLFWCDCSAIFLGHLRFSAMCHAAGDPSGFPHLADSGWLTSSCGGGLAWGWGFLATDILLPRFGFLPCASAAPLPLLPLLGSVPLPGASACLTPVCWSTGVVLCHLVFSTMCCALPQGLQRALLSLMQVHWGFSSHWVSVLLLPW